VLLYQQFPVRTLTRQTAPVVVIWILALWGAAVVTEPVILWLLRTIVVVDGFLVALSAHWLGDFFTKRYAAPLLTLGKERLDVRDVSLRWDEISKFEPIDRFRLEVVGAFVTDPSALLQRMSPMQQTYYGRQLRAYRGAIVVPLVRGMSRSELIELLRNYRAAA
jgi:hypothetical protein